MNRIVKTQKGNIEGVEEKGYVVFKGIPYAKAPVGELRWKAPQEMDAWKGTYKADTFPNMCIQELPKAGHPFMGRFHKEFYNNPEFVPGMGEDCLYLNIWMPEHKEGEKLPVAFWIHGGGFSGGYGSELEFDGEAFCKKRVILVTINYRVNIFGFFAHPWLDAENERHISGNYGILDQIAALKWVHNNIENFGGDNKNITVFGQSAGSMSTQVLCSSKLTEDIPAKAILQSGISCEEEILATPTLEEEEKIGEEFVTLSGKNSLEELREMSAKEIFEVECKLTEALFESGRGLMLVPNVDGYLLEKTVKQIWKDVEMKDIPYMCGAVTDDLGAKPEDVKTDKPGILLEECKRWASVREKTGTPAYLYHFARRLPGDDWGAFHSSELWYTFGTLGRCWRPMTEHDYELSEEMVTCWTNFMKTGNPNGDGQRLEENWESYTGEHPYVKLFK